jgi:hypothetical protein
MRVPLHSVVQVEGTVKSKLTAKKAEQQVRLVLRYGSNNWLTTTGVSHLAGHR